MERLPLDPEPTDTQETLQRPFGAESRRQMLEEWFRQAPTPTVDSAWRHVYRLLLWTDRTTGLAHCYESDKSQPGRPWYARSLAFHKWLADGLAVDPMRLGDEIDWLFRRGTERLTKALERVDAQRALAAAAQRKGYEALPVPGQDAELEALLLDHLAPWIHESPPRAAVIELTRLLRNYFSQEKKRQNLTGEGFEDVLAFILRRLPSAEKLTVATRPLLNEIEGFRAPPRGEKERRVDLVAVRGPRRVLVTAKWSVRADREEQFGVDFEAYARLEDAGQDFEFVLVTNEFDAARLAAACERRAQNAPLFRRVVHVNLEAQLAAYGDEPRRGAARRLDMLIEDRRLVSLQEWLADLTR